MTARTKQPQENNHMRTLLILIFALAGGSLAHAHAFLDHASPRVGSTNPQSPPEVKLWMTEDLEPAFSRVQVFDAKGTEVDRKDGKVKAATMSVSVPILRPGAYLVKWQAVATDTHRTSGTFKFTVQ
jgi:methionine-rich copper-binding protein CopC